MDCNRGRSIHYSLLLKTKIDTRYDTQINVETQRLQRHDRFAMISSLLWRRYILHVYKSERFSFRDRTDRSTRSRSTEPDIIDLDSVEMLLTLICDACSFTRVTVNTSSREQPGNFHTPT